MASRRSGVLGAHIDRDKSATRGDEEYEHHRATRRIHFAVDHAGRDGNELSAPDGDSLSAIATVVEPERTLHTVAGNAPTPVMVPAYLTTSWNPE